jgi:hypothetical protein
MEKINNPATSASLSEICVLRILLEIIKSTNFQKNFYQR